MPASGVTRLRKDGTMPWIGVPAEQRSPDYGPRRSTEVDLRVFVELEGEVGSRRGTPEECANTLYGCRGDACGFCISITQAAMHNAHLERTRHAGGANRFDLITNTYDEPGPILEFKDEPPFKICPQMEPYRVGARDRCDAVRLAVVPSPSCPAAFSPR